MFRLVSVIGWVLLSVGAQASAGVLLTFDVLPGPDGRVGTADDVPYTAPVVFIEQTTQLTNQFALDGILFTPAASTEDKNEIVNASGFITSPPHTAPNVLASINALTIEAEFTTPVFELSALIGISRGADQIEIFDASGASLGVKTGDDEVVSFQTTVPIKRFVVTPDEQWVPAIDNLFFNVPEPTGLAFLMLAASPLLLLGRRGRR